MLNTGYLSSVLVFVRNTLPRFQVDSKAVCTVGEQLCSTRTVHVDHFDPCDRGEVESVSNWIKDNCVRPNTYNEYKRLAGYLASLWFPIMHQFHEISTHSIIAIT